MDRAKVREIRAELKEIINSHFDIQGVTVEVKGARFSTSTATFKVEFFDGEAANKSEGDWNDLAETYGMKKEWLGTNVKLYDKVYKIVGLKASARKNNVIIESRTGKGFVCSAEWVIRAKSR